VFVPRDELTAAVTGVTYLETAQRLNAGSGARDCAAAASCRPRPQLSARSSVHRFGISFNERDGVETSVHLAAGHADTRGLQPRRLHSQRPALVDIGASRDRPGWQRRGRLGDPDTRRVRERGTRPQGAGARWPDVFKLTLYVVATDALATVRAGRDESIDTSTPPTSSLVQVAGLFRPDLLIEVEAVAIAPEPAP